MYVERTHDVIWWVVVLIFLIGCVDESKELTNRPTALDRHLQDYERPQGLWGFIDSTEQHIIAPIYDEVRPFNEGVAAVAFESLWGYIDRSGSYVVKPKYMKAHSFQDEVARVRGADGRMGLINVHGDTVLSFSFAELTRVTTRTFVAEDTNGLKGIITSSGDEVIPIRYNDVRYLWPNVYALKYLEHYSLVNDALVVLQDSIKQVFNQGIVNRLDGFGVIDNSGQWIVPPDYTDIRYSDKNLYLLQSDSSYLYDTHDRIILYRTDKRLKVLHDRRFGMRDGPHWRLIDEKGQSLSSSLFRQIYTFHGGLAPAQIGNLWGFINIHGDWIIQPQFGLTWNFHEGKLRFFGNRGFGFMNKKGLVVISPKYRDVRDFSEGMVAFNK